MKKKLLKWVAITSIVLLIIGTIAGYMTGAYFYDFAINSDPENRPTVAKILNTPSIFTPAEQAMAYREAKEAETYLKWMKEIGYTDMTMTSFDGLRLHGYEIKNNDAGNKWVIICHGYSSKAMDMVEQANKFYNLGFNVFMPDLRGFGKSEGEYYGMGWDDRRDVVNWTQKLVEEHPDAEVVLFGLSMGAATVLNASGEDDLPKNVKVVIEDSGYSSIEDEFRHQLSSIIGLPEFPIMEFATLVTYQRAGYWLGDDDVEKQVKKSKQPILFIHGDADHFVPVEMAEVLYAAAPGPKEKLIVKDATHGVALEVIPNIYWRTIEAFIFKYMQR